MNTNGEPALCPDCDEPLVFAFGSTGGLSGQKRGDSYNATPDTAHYLCFPCGRAWKRRLAGPYTPDVTGDLSFFTCRDHACGAAMTVTRESSTPTGVELTCAQGHRHMVVVSDEGLNLEMAGQE